MAALVGATPGWLVAYYWVGVVWCVLGLSGSTFLLAFMLSAQGGRLGPKKSALATVAASVIVLIVCLTYYVVMIADGGR